MIDLTSAKVGDKYLTEDNQECSVVAIGHYTVCFNLTVVDFLFVTNDDGKPSETHNGCKELTIKCKADPRPWLKDLLDADLFVGEWLACDKEGEWFSFNREPTKFTITFSDQSCSAVTLEGVKMPKLTGDQWKDSKISIKDLKAWQVENLPF